MSREKAGYRDTLALLNERFPDRDLLSRSDVAAFMGVSTATVRRRWQNNGEGWHEAGA